MATAAPAPPPAAGIDLQQRGGEYLGPATSHQRPGPREMLRTLNTAAPFREAYSRGQSLSAYLEEQDPSSRYQDHLDAFERLLYVSDIRVASNGEGGYSSDTWEKFNVNEQTRALAWEWAQRVFTGTSSGRDPSTRALYTSADQPVGSVIEPFVNAAQARFLKFAPAIPLAELVAITTPISGAAYRAFYLTTDVTNQRFNRVAQGAEIPRAKLIGSDHTLYAHKYGKALDITYEVMRRERIDLVGLHIARLAIQTEIDRVAAAIDILVNGDGNAATAATNFNLTTLDSTATAGTMTVKAWMAFKLKFLNPYMLTHILVQSDVGGQLLTMNLGSANIPMAFIQATNGLGEFNVINPQLGDGVRLGVTSDAPSLKIVGIDARFALERFTEIGSEITELERFITRQSQTITMTYNDGFSVLDPFGATKTVNVNA